MTIGIYIDTLRALAKKRRFRIFVHPVLPVLKETRYVARCGARERALDNDADARSCRYAVASCESSTAS